MIPALPMIISIVNAKTRPMTPTMIPTVRMCLTSTMPVLKAIALGGVLTGNIIASDADNVTPKISVNMPPNGSRTLPIPVPTATITGIIRAAVAVLEMMFEKNQQIKPAPMITTIGDHCPNGIAPTK